jgi:hypothetical protein
MNGRPHVQQFYGWHQEDKGFLYHQSLEALQAAATDLNCGLCNLVLDQVLRGQAELEELRPSWEPNESDQTEWPLWEFWLVKRPAGGHGFWVMTFTNDTKRGDARLVAAIGLCVKDGRTVKSIHR